jgi:cytochrome b561
MSSIGSAKTPDSARMGASYSHGAIGFHWLTAAIVIAIIPLGIAMPRVDPGPTMDFIYTLHESLGIVVWPLVIARLIYRLKNPPPPMQEDIPKLMRLAAELTHWALYAGLLVNPILGYLGVSTFGATIDFFWLVELPSIAAKDEALSKLILTAHGWIGILMALALCAHIGGALFHHFIRKDRTLLRMLGR